MELLAQEGLLPKPKAAKPDGDKKAAGDKKRGRQGQEARRDKKPGRQEADKRPTTDKGDKKGGTRSPPDKK